MSAIQTPTIPTVEITNNTLARLAGEGVILGSRHVFMNPGTLFSGDSDIASLLAAFGVTINNAPGYQIHSLVGVGELKVAGSATVHGVTVENSPVGAVFTDRPIYRAGKDEVTVFVAVLNRPSTEINAIVTFGSTRIRQKLVTLDQYGTGFFTMPVSRVGVHTVTLEGTDITCSFEGADYKRAALTAIRLDHKLDPEADTLSVKLQVQSYGRPLPAGTELLLQLRENGSRRGNRKVEVDANSQVSAQWNLQEMRGDLTVFVQVTSAPAKTAEVVIPGARDTERKLFALNHIGEEYGLSLMPHKGAMSLHGLHVSATGVTHNTPFELVDGAVSYDFSLRSNVSAHVVIITSVNPMTGMTDIHEFHNIEPGEVMRVDVLAPWQLFTIGAWIQGDDGLAPWEGGAIIANPSVEQLLDLQVAPVVEPGGTAVVKLRSNRNASVLLVVRMAEFATDEPQSLIARSHRARMDGLANLLTVATPTAKLSEQVSDDYYGYAFEAATLGGPSRGGMLRTLSVLSADEGFSVAIASSAVAKGVPGGGGVQTQVRTQIQLMTELATAREEGRETAFAGIVHLHAGQWVDLPVPVGQSITEMVVDALAVGPLWTTVGAQTRFMVEKPVYADVRVAPSVAPGVKATARVRVNSASGNAAVIAMVNDVPTAVHLDGQTIEPGAIVTTPCEVTFLAPAGNVTVQVIDGDATDMHSVTIATTGYSRYPVQRLVLLPLGGIVNAADLGCIDLRVVPGLDKSFKTMVLALADYRHKCCEQTAAVMQAALVMAIQGGDGGNAGKSHYLAGVEREKLMWQPGRGFKMYPESDHKSDHYSMIASRRLARMETSQQHPTLDLDMRAAVGEAARMGSDGCYSHKISVVPEAITNMRDAFYVASMVRSRVGEAMRFVTAHIQDLGNGQKKAVLPPSRDYDDDPVTEREQTAWAAATCAIANDLANALALANFVVGQLDEHGGLFSTLDMVAGLQMMQELLSIGISGEGTVAGSELLLNGSVMSLEDALAYDGEIVSIEAYTGPVAVQYTVMVETDWSAYKPNMQVETKLRRHLSPGDEADLEIRLPAGYEAGDFVQIALPPSLVSAAEGVQRTVLEIDCAGHDVITVPVQAIERSLDEMGAAEVDHEVIVLGRNMYKENRIGLVRARVKVA